jgi:hypothetical protein
MRRKRRHAGCPTGSGDTHAEPINAEALKDAMLGDAMVARHECSNRFEGHRRH